MNKAISKAKKLAYFLTILSFFVFFGKSEAWAASDNITLNPGWNIISTPKVLDSHVFSAPETSVNFDIYLLNASSTSGWSTMAELGQTEFIPLYGYFINNKTGAAQTLTFNYRFTLDPNLFTRSFNKAGWYSIGVANPQYVKSQFANTVDTNNVSSTLRTLIHPGLSVIDFTAADFPTSSASVRVSSPFAYRTDVDLNNLNDLRETKGYAVFLNTNNAIYNGFQNMDSAGGAVKIINDSVTLAGSPVVGATSTLLGIVRFDAGVVTSSENVSINRIVISDILTGSASSTDITNLSLYNKFGAKITATVTKPSPTNTQFALATPLVVDRSGSELINIVGDIFRAGGGTHSFAVMATSGITAVGTSTGRTILPTLASGNGTPFSIVSSGSLAASVLNGASTPDTDQNVLIGATGTPVLAFTLAAQNEPIRITSLTLVATGTGYTSDIQSVKLYREGDAVPFASAGPSAIYSTASSLVFVFTAANNILPAAIDPGTPINIYARADIGNTAQARLGSSFRFSVTSTAAVTTRGVSSNTQIVPTGLPIAANGVSYISPFHVNIDAEAPVSSMGIIMDSILPGYTLARVKVTNNGYAPISINNIRFTDSANHSATSTGYTLYYSDENGTNYTFAAAAPEQINGFNFTGLNVPITSGSYRYFTLVLSSSGPMSASDAWQMSIQNLGDIKYSTTDLALGYDSNFNGSLSDSTVPLFAEGKAIFDLLVKL